MNLKLSSRTIKAILKNSKNKSSREVVLVASYLPDPTILKNIWKNFRKNTPIVLAVDGGYEHCLKAKIPVTVAIGDWDSGKKPPRNIPCVDLHQNKERSDLFYALKLVKNLKTKRVHIFGAEGGRPDHHLAALKDLAHLSIPSILYGGAVTYYFLNQKKRKFNGRHLVAPISPKDLISLFAINSQVTGLKLKGFRYSAKNNILAPSSQGLSNFLVSKKFSIHWKRGKILMMVFNK